MAPPGSEPADNSRPIDRGAQPPTVEQPTPRPEQLSESESELESELESEFDPDVGVGERATLALELSNVTVRFGTLTALDAVSLSVVPQQRVAVVGPSGSGKSTLLNVVSGLVDATEGSVSVLGSQIDELRGRRLRRHRARIGIVGQALSLTPSLRVVHNVEAGLLGSRSTASSVLSLMRSKPTAEVLAALDRVALADRATAVTDNLSGGEQQRVAVARVLRQTPQLVLADEPTSSVDPRLSDVVMEQLAGPDVSWTSVVSAHDPDLARRHSERMIGLKNGKIAFDLASDSVTNAMLAELYQGP